MSLAIQSYPQLMIGVSNHLLSKVFRFHYHSQKVIGFLGCICTLPKTNMAREIPIFNRNKYTSSNGRCYIAPCRFSGGRGWSSIYTSIRHHINHRCLTSNHQTHPESLTNGTHKVMVEHGWTKFGSSPGNPGAHFQVPSLTLPETSSKSTWK